MKDAQDPPATVGPALVGIRAHARAQPPLITAPMTVERPPRTSGGPAAAVVGINDTLRKPGLVRGLRLLRALNQAEGFVCSGCAWPTPDRRARRELCERGVRAVAHEASLRRAGPRLFATYTVPELAQRSDHWLGSQGRLTEPMIRRPESNAYEPISWDAAIELIGSTLAGLSDPVRAVFYSSARVSNEAGFSYQLLARALGTNNIPTSSQLYHEASRVALRGVLGDPVASVSLADFAAADAIFLFGCNPGSSHPRMLETLRAAKQRGATIVAFNPLREASLLAARDPRRPSEWFGAGVTIADRIAPVAIGGDRAAIIGMTKAVLEADAVDRSFVDANTTGFAALEAAIGEWSWAAIVEHSGLDEPTLRATADIYMRSKATIACWGLGLTQHADGVGTIEQLLSLLLLRGNTPGNKPGAGPLALLDHSNTRGCWTMGVEPEREPAALDQLAAATGLELAREPGFDVTSALAAMGRGEVEVFISLGGNLLSSGPDTEQVAASLHRCKLSVHVATTLNRAHLITGEVGLLLPCLGRSELDQRGAKPRWVSFEDMTGIVRASTGRLAPASPSLRSEIDIITAIGAAAGAGGGRIDWSALGEDYDRIRELIAAAIPGCEGFATELGRDRSLNLRKPPPRTATLTAPRSPDASGEPRAAHEFLLTTVRSHDQHNSTIYAYGDRERGIAGYRRLVLANLADIRRLEIEPFDQVDLTSHFNGQQLCARKWVVVPHHIPEGMLAAYWPEANALVPTGHVDPRSGTPASKSVRVTVERSV